MLYTASWKFIGHQGLWQTHGRNSSPVTPTASAAPVAPSPPAAIPSARVDLDPSGSDDDDGSCGSDIPDYSDAKRRRKENIPSHLDPGGQRSKDMSSHAMTKALVVPIQSAFTFIVCIHVYRILDVDATSLVLEDKLLELPALLLIWLLPALLLIWELPAVQGHVKPCDDESPGGAHAKNTYTFVVCIHL